MNESRQKGQPQVANGAKRTTIEDDDSFALPRPPKRFRRMTKKCSIVIADSHRLNALENDEIDIIDFSMGPQWTSTPIVTPTKAEGTFFQPVMRVEIAAVERRILSSPRLRQRVCFSPPKLPKESGAVYVVGEGNSGQLGLGSRILSALQPMRIKSSDLVVSVAAGDEHTLFLTNKGEVYSFGCNEYGSLGRQIQDGRDSSAFEPRKIVHLPPASVVQIAAGQKFSAALTRNGEVYIWGEFLDSFGVMGLMPMTPDCSPTRIMNFTTVVDISAGRNHLACLSSDGQVFTFGCGEHGQLGRISGKVCRMLGRFAASSHEQAGLIPINGYIPPTCLTWGPMVTADENTRLPPFDKIWTGPNSTFARALDSGYIYACGENYDMELGFKDGAARYFPEPCDFFPGCKCNSLSSNGKYTLAIDKNYKVRIVGSHRQAQTLGLGSLRSHFPAPISELSKEKCISVHCGNDLSYAITDKGSLYSWGDDRLGRLLRGRGVVNKSPFPVTSQVLKGKVVIQVQTGKKHAVLLLRPRFQIKSGVMVL